MIDLTKLTPFGRKQWVKRKWDEYEASLNAATIKLSLKVYGEPADEKFADTISKGKWKSTVDRKVNYLLARPPICTDHQQLIDELADFIKESAKQCILRGSLIWIVQGDGVQIEPKPLIMNNTIAVYKDEYRETAVAFIRKYVDIELEESTGAETEREYLECYYVEGDEDNVVAHRDTFCYSLDDRDKYEVLEEKPLFIELGKTGDAPLFAYVDKLLVAFDHIMRHQDKTVEKNTKPLVEVRGYSGTSDEDLTYAIDELSIARTDGNGGVTIHSRSMDSAAIDLWAKRLLQEWYEATCTVGKENELQYAVSGKAMDRLFVDMENSARELAHVLEQALKAYFEYIGYEDVDIVWNTDRPVDDASIIQAIVSSRGLLSDRTLIEQHPWVDDVDEELRRLEEQNTSGFNDLMETEDPDEEFGHY